LASSIERKRFGVRWLDTAFFLWQARWRRQKKESKKAVSSHRTPKPKLVVRHTTALSKRKKAVSSHRTPKRRSMLKFRVHADDTFLILAPRWADLGTYWQMGLLALLLFVPFGLILWLCRYELRLVSR